MAETPKINTISLIDIARAQKVGPIALGSRLSDFANEVGPPRRWAGFSEKHVLSCWMIFGEVEVGFLGGEGDLLVQWIKIIPYRFTRSYMKFARKPEGEELRIHNPFGVKYPRHDYVAERLTQAGIEYSTEVEKRVLLVMPPLIRSGVVTFYFSEDRKQELVSIFLEPYVNS